MAALREIRKGLWHLRRGGPAQFRSWRARQRTEQGFAAPRNVQGVEAAWTGRGRKRRLSLLPAVLPQQQPSRPDVRAAVILDDFSALAFGYEWSTLAGPSAHVAHRPGCRRCRSVVRRIGVGGKRRTVARQTGRPERPQCRVPRTRQLVPGTGHRHRLLEQGRPAPLRGLPPRRAALRPGLHLRFRPHSAVPGGSGPRAGQLPFRSPPSRPSITRSGPRHGRHSRDVAFAGMYFAHKYPERRAQMDFLLGGALDASARMRTGLEIFSRQLGGNAEYQFPAPLDSRVVGSLSYPQMLSAYKAYKVFLNVNSVVDSPQHVCPAHFRDHGIRNSGRDRTQPGHGAVLPPGSGARGRHPQGSRTPYPRAGLQPGVERPHRAPGPAHHLGGPHLHPPGGHRPAARPPGPQRRRPRGRPCRCCCRPSGRRTWTVSSGPWPGSTAWNRNWCCSPTASGSPPSGLAELSDRSGLRNVVLLEAPREVSLGECLNRCVDASGGQVLTKMDDDDHYGPQYLSDQLHAMSYSGADVVGKQAHYMHLETSNAAILSFAAREHRFTDFVMGPTIMARRDVFTDHPFQPVAVGEDTGFPPRRPCRRQGHLLVGPLQLLPDARRRLAHTWPIDR